MVYYSDDIILIRTIVEKDPMNLLKEELEQGHHTTVDRYTTRINDQESGKAIALVAEYKGNVAGYVNVYINPSHAGSYEGKGYCAIVDFGVFRKFRNNGIGSKLLDVAENIAAEYADTVFLGVGLHSGYGSAQRMYIKRGYIPDGTGVWYNNEILKPYSECKNDDDLILFLSKKLR